MIWDAVIVGAGIAGATVARSLAQRGHSVLLVERKTFPRYKVCGCCLNRRSIHYLDEAGITPRLKQLGAPALEELSLYAAGRRANITLPGGMAVSRNRLDSLLADAAMAAGATLRYGQTASLDRGTHSTTCRVVHLSGADGVSSVRARLVVAADGLGGKVLHSDPHTTTQVARFGYVGLGALVDHHIPEIEPGRIHMICSPGGYVGYVRVENGALALAAAVKPAILRHYGGPAGCVENLFRHARIRPPVKLSALHWTGTPILTRQPQRTAGHRLVALGDAAGYVEPFTGEGMAWAMEGAQLLDRHLDTFSPAHWDESAERWEAAYRQGMAGRRRWCRSLSTALRIPGLSAATVRLLARLPSLSAPVLVALNRTTRS